MGTPTRYHLFAAALVAALLSLFYLDWRVMNAGIAVLLPVKLYTPAPTSLDYSGGSPLKSLLLTNDAPTSAFRGVFPA
jgi:hypothetical protein